MGDALSDSSEFVQDHRTSGRARPRRLPRFRGTARDKIRPGGGRGDMIRMRLRSAFTPSHPVISGEMYAGRAAVLDKLIRAIEEQQLHVIIFGTRGIGKTSTLHVLREIAQDARYLVRYDSCGEKTNFSDLFRAILSDIPLLFHENYDPTSDEAEEGLSFADLLPNTPLTVAWTSDVLSKIAGTRLLIVLDELDRAEDPDFRRSIAELMKNLSDRASRVQLVLAGVAQNLTQIVEHIPSIRRNILGFELPNMTDAEIAELIRNGETSSGLPFSDDAVDLICSLSLGLPYLASLLGHHAGLSALDREADRVDLSDVGNAFEQALGEIELRIGPMHRHQIDEAIAQGGESRLGAVARMALVKGGKLPAANAGVNAPYDNDYVQSLARSSRLIAPIEGDPEGAYAFVDDGLPLYLWVRVMKDQVYGKGVPAA